MEDSKKERVFDITGGPFSISGCSVEMNLNVGEVVNQLAKSMEEQAVANKANSDAMFELASKLVPQNPVGFNITQVIED